MEHIKTAFLRKRFHSLPYMGIFLSQINVHDNEQNQNK